MTAIAWNAESISQAMDAQFAAIVLNWSLKNTTSHETRNSNDPDTPILLGLRPTGLGHGKGQHPPHELYESDSGIAMRRIGRSIGNGYGAAHG